MFSKLLRYGGKNPAKISRNMHWVMSRHMLSAILVFPAGIAITPIWHHRPEVLPPSSCRHNLQRLKLSKDIHYIVFSTVVNHILIWKKCKGNTLIRIVFRDKIITSAWNVSIASFLDSIVQNINKKYFRLSTTNLKIIPYYIMYDDMKPIKVITIRIIRATEIILTRIFMIIMTAVNIISTKCKQ